ncbi:uncharacterized protein I303_104772 [Kwoniella dejecticola CBS 10117]|uniref:trans-L-3-hydroxyproline dehydratase n=1 Tax=Kwoniella dejecticola CBS 10117 TaxID=1296121 RepID=A0A1A6A4E3_9TREE|nr:uncharacterized protein I303_04247 [Kwoniella dejecticola CBS 10117]OBR84924.1 hypothetical protein I303_04247 [Kwoniella dejecticola CBS 10117]
MTTHISNSKQSPYWVSSEDWHTAGEPFRIVSELPPHASTTGSTVRERRLNIVNTPHHPLDILRQALCQEPRGHADMYGGFITPPDDEGAHFGVLFWHKDGFSTACGHGTIALGYWAINNGIVKPQSQDGITEVIIDVPSGRVTASLTLEKGEIVFADFVNVPSYQLAQNVSITLPSTGISIKLDLSWGGAVYAYVDASQFGLKVDEKGHDDFVKLGREIKATLGEKGHHKGLELYGVCFYTDGEDTKEMFTSRNVVVFADGQIDRSPCGSGTAARAALLHAQGKLPQGKVLQHYSIINTLFKAQVLAKSDESPTEFGAVIPQVRGLANLMGRNSFYIDQADPTFPGFVFR